MSRSLILIRHGESEWNAQNRFTGWRDPPLTERGEAQAQYLGGALRVRGKVPDVVFTSALLRARSTAQHILDQFESSVAKMVADAALNERNYGALTGLNKDEARARFGEEQVHLWRRSLNVAPPGGESLADTAARTVPYLQDRILPAVPRDGVCLVVAHGNSLRSLVMHLEALSAHAIEDINLKVGEARVYSLDAQDRVLDISSIAASALAYSLDMQDRTASALKMVMAYLESIPETPDFATPSIVVEERFDLAFLDCARYRTATHPSATSKTARMT